MSFAAAAAVKTAAAFKEENTNAHYQIQPAVVWLIKQEYFSHPKLLLPQPLIIILGFSLLLSHSLHKREPRERI